MRSMRVSPRGPKTNIPLADIKSQNKINANKNIKLIKDFVPVASP